MNWMNQKKVVLSNSRASSSSISIISLAVSFIGGQKKKARICFMQAFFLIIVVVSLFSLSPSLPTLLQLPPVLQQCVP
jgi:hypothetical protein